MLQIHCPYCNETREEEEFTYSGEAHITRPLDPDSLSDAEWGDYLFFRKNPRGLHHEMWNHAAGCRHGVPFFLAHLLIRAELGSVPLGFPCIQRKG